MKICLTCGICCTLTEMQLSQEDIRRIEEKSKKKWTQNDFCEFKDGFFELKNIDQHCVFWNLQTKECQIYTYRPKGCEFYPLIFNSELNQCELDPDCPHRHLFYRHPPEYQKKCKDLRDWVKNSLALNQSNN